MRTMMRDGRSEELRALLTDLFSEDTAATTVERLRERTTPARPDP